MKLFPPAVLDVIAAVADEHGLAPSEVLGRGCRPQLARARVAVMRRLRDSDQSETTIGRYFGITQQAVSIALKRAAR